MAELPFARRAIAFLAGFLSDSLCLRWFGLPSRVVSSQAAAEVKIVRQKKDHQLFELPHGLVWTRGAHLDRRHQLVEDFSHGIDRPMAWWFIRRRRFFPTIEQEKRRLFSLTGDAADNLYHWTFDILPRLQLLQPEDLSSLRVLSPLKGAYHRTTLLAFGFREDQLIPLGKAPFHQADQLWFAQTPRGVSAGNVRFIRELYTRMIPAGPGKPLRLYISRAKATSRRIVGEAELEEGLRQRGFQIAFFEELSFPEQLALMARATIIVAAHGAAWTLAVVAQPGTPVIEILPAAMEKDAPFNFHLYRHLCREIGLDYRAHLASSAPRDVGTQKAQPKSQQSDIAISTPQLLTEIDACIAVH